MSGKPIASPRASCFFETSWKFDQIAGSPITRVCTAGVVRTSARRRRVASSIAFDDAAAVAEREERRAAAVEKHDRLRARRPASAAAMRRASRTRRATSAGVRPVTKTVKTGVCRLGKSRWIASVTLDRRAARHLPAAAREVVALVEREPAARGEERDPDGEDGAPAPRDGACKAGEFLLDHRSLCTVPFQRPFPRLYECGFLAYHAARAG